MSGWLQEEIEYTTWQTRSVFVGRVGANQIGRKKLAIEKTWRETWRDESSVLDKSMPAGGIEEGVEGDWGERVGGRREDEEKRSWKIWVFRVVQPGGGMPSWEAEIYKYTVG